MAARGMLAGPGLTAHLDSVERCVPSRHGRQHLRVQLPRLRGHTLLASTPQHGCLRRMAAGCQWTMRQMNASRYCGAVIVSAVHEGWRQLHRRHGSRTVSRDTRVSSSTLKSPPMRLDSGSGPLPDGVGTTRPLPVSSYTRGSGADSTSFVVISRPASSCIHMFSGLAAE